MIQCRHAAPADLDLLARWNRTLQEDEGHDPMSLQAITDRLRRWLSDNYQAVCFEVDGQPIGYALYRPTDPDTEGPGIFLRQFFIDRNHRRQGLGTAAYGLFEQHITGDQIVALEVLASNPAGHQFWQSLGFRDYSTTYLR